jgi:hypothetical protein
MEMDLELNWYWNFKVWLGKIKMVVHANKMARPWMEKSNFLRMNSRIISQFGKGIWIVKLSLTLFVGMFVTFILYDGRNI